MIKYKEEDDDNDVKRNKFKKIKKMNNFNKGQSVFAG